MKQGGKKKKSFWNPKWNRNTLIFLIIALIVILAVYYISTSEGETRNIVSIQKANNDNSLLETEITVEGYYNRNLNAITRSIDDTGSGETIGVNTSVSFNQTQLNTLNDGEKYYFTGVLKEKEDETFPAVTIKVLELIKVETSG